MVESSDNSSRITAVQVAADKEASAHKSLQLQPCVVNVLHLKQQEGVWLECQ
jgi:hypothetical protein